MPNNSGLKEKATGWKIPLLFCAGIIAIVLLVTLLRDDAPKQELSLPQELVNLAQNIVIDMNTSANKVWKERLLSAASGFLPRETKDERLYTLANEAIWQEHPDVACTAAVLLANIEQRDAVFSNVLTYSLSSCENLPWGVFAVRGVNSPDLKQLWAEQLENLWSSCHKGGAVDGTPPKP